SQLTRKSITKRPEKDLVASLRVRRGLRTGAECRSTFSLEGAYRHFERVLINRVIVQVRTKAQVRGKALTVKRVQDRFSSTNSRLFFPCDRGEDFLHECSRCDATLSPAGIKVGRRILRDDLFFRLSLCY